MLVGHSPGPVAVWNSVLVGLGLLKKARGWLVQDGLVAVSRGPDDSS